MSYSFVKTYLLSQQTPLIHFQYDQEGATLRATEVKPKLDQYLIQRFKADNPGKAIPDNWWINPEKDKKTGEVIVKALNYRMTIQTPENAKKKISNQVGPSIEAHKERILEWEAEAQSKNEQARFHNRRAKDFDKVARAEINGMYFGNMVGEKDDQGQLIPIEEYEKDVKEKYKETVFYNDLITITIICKCPTLMDEIDKSLGNFFLLYNFGTRQSKGFGGFILKKTDGPLMNVNDAKNLYNQCDIPYFWFDTRGSSNEQQLELASAVYAIMKGGVNHTMIPSAGQKAYVKGYIQRRYLDDLEGLKPENERKHIGSEKVKIKTAIFRLNNGTLPAQFSFVRALLGLPDHYEFRRLPGIYGTATVNVYSLGENSFDIERFHSPVTIKIINQRVFFLFNDAEPILNKTFYLLRGSPSGTTYNEQKEDIMRRGKIIHTPTAIDWQFFIKKFIEYFEEEQRKTDGGMKDCNPPIKLAINIKLQNGCDSK